MKIIALAPIEVEILLWRRSPQKIETDSGISSLKNAQTNFKKEITPFTNKRFNINLLLNIISLKKYRIYYFFVFLLIIFLGIFSRKFETIPLCTGDFLYAIMICLFIRILFINKEAIQIAIISLLICYLIEFSQLYQAIWINEVRNTLLGRYTLGQGFLWSDILAYTFGVFASFIIEKIALKTNFYRR